MHRARRRVASHQLPGESLLAFVRAHAARVQSTLPKAAHFHSFRQRGTPVTGFRPTRDRKMRPLIAALLAARAAAVPSTPPPASANAAALRRDLARAVADGDASFAVAPGSYVFSNESLYLTDARDLAIDAYGATFVFYYGFGFQLQNCVNVTVRGLVFDAEPPNYAQGVVTSVGSGNSSVVATFDASFLEPDTTLYPFSSPSGVYGAKVSFWDASTRTVLPPNDFLAGATAKVGDGWSVPLKTPRALEVGQLVVVWPRAGYTWMCANCTDCAAVDVTIYAGGNMVARGAGNTEAGSRRRR